MQSAAPPIGSYDLKKFPIFYIVDLVSLFSGKTSYLLHYLPWKLPIGSFLIGQTSSLFLYCCGFLLFCANFSFSYAVRGKPSIVSFIVKQTSIFTCIVLLYTIQYLINYNCTRYTLYTCTSVLRKRRMGSFKAAVSRDFFGSFFNYRTHLGP